MPTDPAFAAAVASLASRAKLFPRILFALMLCAAPAARSAAAPASPGDDADILPYLEDGTFIVARVDVGRVDHEALEKFVQRAAQAVFAVIPVPANQRPMIEQNAKQSAQETTQWLTDMAAAGGKRVYFLLGTAALSGGDDEPLIVVPVEAGADAAAIAEVMRRGPGKPDDVAEIGKAVVLARAEERERLQKNFEPGAAAPAGRPHLTAAMKAAGDGPMRIAFIPDDATRTWIEGTVPKIPDALGGGEPAVLSRGVRWAAAGVTQKPETVAHVTVQAENAEHAKALVEFLTKAAALVQLTAPAAAPADEAAAKQAADAMTPKLQGETIKLSIDPIAIQMTMMSIQMQQIRGGAAAPAAPVKPGEGL
jgi:hypothetical protein